MIIIGIALLLLVLFGADTLFEGLVLICAAIIALIGWSIAGGLIIAVFQLAVQL